MTAPLHPSAPTDPAGLVGSVIDGRYRLVALLAQGGMGAVFRAEHVYMRKELALKLLRQDLTTAPDIVERFRREAEIAASLEHPHIVRVTDFGKSPEGYLFLVMELLDGESLFERLRRGPFEPEEAVSLLVQVCAGLEAAHARGVVHRDLKPENIFLVPEGGRTVAKILDFGIAKITDPAAVGDTQAGLVVGTPEYLSPEQALGSPVDGRADLYTVGLMAWRMLAGRHPFEAEDPRSLLMMQATRTLPPLAHGRSELARYPALAAAVARACEKDAANRPASAAELKALFERSLDAVLAPTPVGPLRTPRRAGQTPPAPSGAPALPAVTEPVPAPPFAEPDAASGSGGHPAPTAPPPAATPPPVRAGGALAALAAVARRIPRGVRPLAIAAAFALVVVAGALGLRHWAEVRPVSRAEKLLARGQSESARAELRRALERRPRDARLHVLLGRALHDGGQVAAGIEALERSQQLDPRALRADAAALRALAGDLARERRLADRAARLLVAVGAPAAPAVSDAAGEGPGYARLRALELLRELGPPARLDLGRGYAALLADPDCEVRKGASRRLGELGAASAVPKLKLLAESTAEKKGFLGMSQTVPGCGAAEAAAAMRQIDEKSARRARAD